MSAGDAAGRTAAIPAPPKHEPLWAIGVSALLVALGHAHRRADPSPGQGDPVGLDARRGRFAQGPSEIPALGWKDIFLRVYKGISDDRILANAAGVTYYALLALFPVSQLSCRFTVSLKTPARSSAMSMRWRGSPRAVQST